MSDIKLHNQNAWPECQFVILKPGRMSVSMVASFAASTHPSSTRAGYKMHWLATSDPNRLGIGFLDWGAVCQWVKDNDESPMHLTFLRGLPQQPQALEEILVPVGKTFGTLEHKPVVPELPLKTMPYPGATRRAQPDAPPSLRQSCPRAEILEYLIKHPNQTTRQVGDALGVNSRVTSAVMVRMWQGGRLLRRQENTVFVYRVPDVSTKKIAGENLAPAQPAAGVDPELKAVGTITNLLRSLEPAAAARVMAYTLARFGGFE